MNSEKFFRNFFRKRNNLAYNIFMYLGMNQNGKITYQRQIAEYFKKTESTINYHITKFKGEGLIGDNLELSNKGKKLFNFVWNNAGIEKLRAHNIQIKFNLTKCPENYVKRYSRSIFEPFSNGRYSGFKGKFNDITFMFYSTKKIVCTFKDIFGNNDEEISSALQIIVMEIRDLLEEEFKGIKIGGFEFAKIQTSHIAILDSILAEKLDVRNFTYEGKRFALDKSHGRNELEATNSVFNLTEIMKLLGLDDELKQLNQISKNK